MGNAFEGTTRHGARGVRVLIAALAISLVGCGAQEIDPAAQGAEPPVDAPVADARASAERAARLERELATALEGLGGATLEELEREFRAAADLEDGAARAEALERFDREHGELVWRAIQRMRETPGTSGWEAVHAPATPPSIEADAPTGSVGLAAEPLCATPTELEPTPPYFTSGRWGGGAVDVSTGRFTIRSASTLAFDSIDGIFVRADHIPHQAGITTVDARINFGRISVVLLAYIFGYGYADVNTRIIVTESNGTHTRDCGIQIVDVVNGIWAAERHSSLIRVERCSYTSVAERLQAAVVHVGAHTTAGGTAQANAFTEGTIESIRATTCF